MSRFGAESAELAGFSWRGAPGFRAALEPDVTSLLEGDTGLRARLLERTRVREVWRVDGAPGLFVKRYLSPTAAVGLRARLRGSKARREAESASALDALGFATARPLAVGERSGPGAALESVLVTEALPHRAGLAVALARPDAAGPSRRRLLDGLGAYLAALHAAGVAHRDLHGGNLLLLDVPEPRFALIDLDGLRLDRRLSPRRRAVAVARTLHDLRHVTSRSDRLRVLRAYLHAAHLADAEPSLRLHFERGWRREARRALRSGTRRALRRGSLFDQAREPGRRLYWRRALGRDLAVRALESHDEAVASGRGEFLKRSRRVCVTRHALGPGPRVVVKESFDPVPWAPLRRALLGSRARRAWVAAQRLDFLGFTTARCVALREGRGGAESDALVTLSLDGWTPLDPAFQRRFGRQPLPREELRAKRRVLWSVARTVRRLHAAGIYHRDLSGRNVFVSPDAERPEVALLDLESIRRQPLTGRRRAANLCQLLETLDAGHGRDALRFLRDYGLRDPAERQRWLERIEELGRRRLGRRARRARRRARRLAGSAA